MIKEKLKTKRGITLIALVVTIVVLLVLTGVTIRLIISDNGIIKKAIDARDKTDIAETRETIELILEGATIEKSTNHKYNQNEFLDDYIYNQNSDIEIVEDEINLNGYTFDLDRSIPKLEKYIGKIDQLPPRIRKVNVVDRKLDAIQVETLTLRADEAKYIYSYKKQGQQEYISSEKIDTKNYTFHNLEQGQNYEIKVEMIINDTIIDSYILQETTKKQVYIWEKWEVKENVTYNETLIASNETIELRYLLKSYIYTGYKIENNRYVLTNGINLGTYADKGGAPNWSNWVVNQLKNYVKGGGSTIFKTTSSRKTSKNTADGQSIFEVTGNRYEMKKNVTYFKGESYIEEVMSINKNEYPSNGKSGDFWYVFKKSIIE